MAQAQQHLATSGTGFSPSYTYPNLENKFLAQSSTLTTHSHFTHFTAQPSSCSSLQPSSLSSTTSSLLSSSSLSSSLTSPLLTTQNKLLTSHSPHLSFSLTSSIPNAIEDSAMCLTSSVLFSHHAPPFHRHGLGDEGEGGNKKEMSKVMQPCFEETSRVHDLFLICFTFLRIIDCTLQY